VTYNITLRWQDGAWTWLGEAVLPGGRRYRLPAGSLINVAENKIAAEVSWVVRCAIDALDFD